jgi:CDP-diglyceride synthetase
MLHKRVISGLLFLPIFYLIAWKLPPVYFTGLVLAAVLVGLHEFYRIEQARGSNPNAVLGSMIGALIVLESYQPLLNGMGKAYLGAGLLLIAEASRARSGATTCFSSRLGRIFSRNKSEGSFNGVEKVGFR